MALGSGNVELLKKNSKFESFLKRTISEEAFERVRAYESCIVVSEKENKSFKFAVLSDERIYLTENPPKTLTEVVHLRDVVSVELVNEFPDFLTGSERSNTQHIAISFMTADSSRRRSLRRSRKSPRGSLSEGGGDRSNASTPLGYSSSADSGLEDQLSHSLLSLGQSRPTSRGSIKALATSGGKKKKKNSGGLNDSLDHDSILRSLKEEIEEDMLEDIEEDRLSMMKSTVAPSRSGSAIFLSPSNKGNNSNSNNAYTGNHHLNDSLNDSGNSSRNRRRSVNSVSGAGGAGGAGAGAPAPDSVSLRSAAGSQHSVRPLPPVPRTGAFETPAVSVTGVCVGKSTDTLNSSTQSSKQPLVTMTQVEEVEKVDEKGCCLFFKCCGQKNQVSPIYKNAKIIKDTGGTNKTLMASNGSSHLGSRIEINPPPSRGSSIRGGSRAGTPSLLDTDRNINELNSSSSDLGRISSFMGLNSLSVDGPLEKRKCILNIYLLNLTSPLLMLMRSAWNNYIIKSTLWLEPGEMEISTAPVPLSASNRNKAEREYSHLKRDLFQAHLSLEEQMALIEQLRTSTRKNFLMKKLFWRNPDVLIFLISQLQKYLPRSSAILTTDEGKAQRADEIEFATVVLSTINLMFRESEILPSRLQTLRLESCKTLSDLLSILMCQPDMPYQPITLTKHWSAPLASGGKGSKVEKNLDEELARLKTEYTRIAITTIFELFQVARQAPSEEGSVLTISGMVALFDASKCTEKFVDKLLAQVMELVSLSRFDLLTPTHAMLVYQMFTILLQFLEQSKAVTAHVRNNYYEEFKYFIQAPAVSRKLPPQYPITATTITTIDSVVAIILGVQSTRAGSKVS